MIKILQTHKWPSKVPNLKTLYDPGDLENTVKVKLITCKGLVVRHLMYKYKVSTSNG